MSKKTIILPLILVAMAFVSCEGPDPSQGQNEFSFVTLGEGDRISEVIDKDWSLDAKVGDTFLLGVTDGTDTWAWLDRYEWSVSDPAVATVYMGVLAVLQGGESTVTLKAEGYETTFTVSAPQTPHGKVFLTSDASQHHDETGSFYPQYRHKLFVDGVMTGETCHFVTAGKHGNLWQGAFADGTISLKLNGRPVGSGIDFTNDFPGASFREIVQAEAAGDRLVMILGSKSGHTYRIVSSDGSVMEGPIDGNVADVDEDSQGNITMWGLSYMVGTVWRISRDGTISKQNAPGDGHLIINAGLDDSGNEYVLCSLGDGDHVIFRNGDVLYRFQNTFSPKMIIRGKDVLMAYFSTESDGNYAMYLFKNGESKRLAGGFLWSNSADFDFCISTGGDPYVACHGVYGLCVFKDTAPALLIPGSDFISPSVAVID